MRNTAPAEPTKIMPFLFPVATPQQRRSEPCDAAKAAGEYEVMQTLSLERPRTAVDKGPGAAARTRARACV